MNVGKLLSGRWVTDPVNERHRYPGAKGWIYSRPRDLDRSRGGPRVIYAVVADNIYTYLAFIQAILGNPSPTRADNTELHRWNFLYLHSLSLVPDWRITKVFFLPGYKLRAENKEIEAYCKKTLWQLHYI